MWSLTRTTLSVVMTLIQRESKYMCMHMGILRMNYMYKEGRCIHVYVHVCMRKKQGVGAWL